MAFVHGAECGVRLMSGSRGALPPGRTSVARDSATPNTKSRTVRASLKRTSYLRRVNVDVDLTRIEFEVQHEHWMAAVEQHVAIRLFHRVRDDVVLHRAAVDEEELMIGLRARMRRRRDPPMQSQAVVLLPRSALRRREIRPPSSCATRRRPIGCARRQMLHVRCRCALRTRHRSVPAQVASTTSFRCASSVRSVFRNLRRAGVL